MPVILTSREEVEVWLTADWRETRALTGPLADEDLVPVEDMGGEP